MKGSVVAATLDRLGSTTIPQPTVSIADNARHLVLKVPPGGGRRIGGGIRGAIKTFTKSARRRVLCYFNELDLKVTDQRPLFITLTYHNTWPSTGQGTKAHLHAFCKRLVRRYANAAIVWRLEYQARGAPHYHLLVFGVPFIPRAWVSDAWWEVCGRGTDAHRRSGTNIERIRSWRGVLAYASKYLAKLGATVCDTSPGRFWGVIHGSAIRRCIITQEVCWVAWYQMRRLVWRYQARLAITAGRRTALVGNSVFMPAIDAMRLLSLAIDTG